MAGKYAVGGPAAAEAVSLPRLQNASYASTGFTNAIYSGSDTVNVVPSSSLKRRKHKPLPPQNEYRSSARTRVIGVDDWGSLLYWNGQGDEVKQTLADSWRRALTREESSKRSEVVDEERVLRSDINMVHSTLTAMVDQLVVAHLDKQRCRKAVAQLMEEERMEREYHHRLEATRRQLMKIFVIDEEVIRLRIASEEREERTLRRFAEIAQQLQSLADWSYSQHLLVTARETASRHVIAKEEGEAYANLRKEQQESHSKVNMQAFLSFSPEHGALDSFRPWRIGCAPVGLVPSPPTAVPACLSSPTDELTPAQQWRAGEKILLNQAILPQERARCFTPSLMDRDLYGVSMSCTDCFSSDFSITSSSLTPRPPSRTVRPHRPHTAMATRSFECGTPTSPSPRPLKAFSISSGKLVPLVVTEEDKARNHIYTEQLEQWKELSRVIHGAELQLASSAHRRPIYKTASEHAIGPAKWRRETAREYTARLRKELQQLEAEESGRHTPTRDTPDNADLQAIRSVLRGCSAPSALDPSPPPPPPQVPPPRASSALQRPKSAQASPPSSKPAAARNSGAPLTPPRVPGTPTWEAPSPPRENKQTQAAVKIQKAQRSRLARKEAERRSVASGKSPRRRIQRAATEELPVPMEEADDREDSGPLRTQPDSLNQDQAAMKIQRGVRSHHARRELNRRKAMRDAALHERAVAEESTPGGLKARTIAATTIQTAMRRCLARIRRRNRAEAVRGIADADNSKDKACLAIQQAFRRFLARRHFHERSAALEGMLRGHHREDTASVVIQHALRTFLARKMVVRKQLAIKAMLQEAAEREAEVEREALPKPEGVGAGAEPPRARPRPGEYHPLGLLAKATERLVQHGKLAKDGMQAGLGPLFSAAERLKLIQSEPPTTLDGLTAILHVARGCSIECPKLSQIAMARPQEQGPNNVPCNPQADLLDAIARNSKQTGDVPQTGTRLVDLELLTDAINSGKYVIWQDQSGKRSIDKNALTDAVVKSEYCPMLDSGATPRKLVNMSVLVDLLSTGEDTPLLVFKCAAPVGPASTFAAQKEKEAVTESMVAKRCSTPQDFDLSTEPSRNLDSVNSTSAVKSFHISKAGGGHPPGVAEDAAGGPTAKKDSIQTIPTTMSSQTWESSVVRGTVRYRESLTSDDHRQGSTAAHKSGSSLMRDSLHTFVHSGNYCTAVSDQTGDHDMASLQLSGGSGRKPPVMRVSTEKEQGVGFSELPPDWDPQQSASSPPQDIKSTDGCKSTRENPALLSIAAVSPHSSDRSACESTAVQPPSEVRSMGDPSVASETPSPRLVSPTKS